MSHIKFFCIITSCLILATLTSCEKFDKKPKVYQEKDAMEILLELTPEESVEFYKINYKLNPYLDSLYIEEIMPLFVDIPLGEFKTVVKNLSETPVEEYAVTIYEDVYDEYIAEIADELDSLTIEQQTVFSEDVLPILEVALDSMICEDINAVIEEYSGGFLNYRKLALFGGRNSTDFKEKWTEIVDTKKYNQLINDFVDDYFSSLNEFHNEYVANTIGDHAEIKNKYNVRKTKIEFNLACMSSVDAYNSREKNGMIKDFLKDWVAPAALAVFTGGASTVVSVYEAASFGYDIYVTVDDIKNLNPTSEDILMYECASSLETQVENYIFTPMQNEVFGMIEKNNSQILEEIALYYKL